MEQGVGVEVTFICIKIDYRLELSNAIEEDSLPVNKGDNLSLLVLLSEDRGLSESITTKKNPGLVDLTTYFPNSYAFLYSS